MTNKLGPVTELLRGPGLRVPTGARGTATPMFGPNYAKLPKHLNMLITKILGAVLVASGPLNSYKNFHQDLTKND